MKRVMLLLALSNAVLFAVISCKNEQTAIADKETATTECYSGGNGTRHCDIPAGIDINGETSVGCSVTCDEGYYACCGTTCKCLPET